MKYISLLEGLEKAFSNYEKPLAITNENEPKGEYLEIQRDFSGLSRYEMTYDQCSMMLVDGPMISDKAFLYFIPRLAKCVFQEGGRGNGYLFYKRLETINKNLLTSEQKEIITCLIDNLKKLEQKIKIEEEKELKQAQIDWEEERLVSEKVEDKLLLAIARGNINEVKSLISHGANINERDNHGNSPLDIARYRGHTKIVELLEQSGAR